MPTYRIVAGDSLSTIAARNGTTAAVLARLNGIQNPNRIAAGQTLRLPGQNARDTFQPAAQDATRVATPTPSASGTALQRRLADAARQTALSMGGSRSLGQCAKGVNRAILSAMGFRNYGHANQIDNNLPRSRFRELHIPLEQALRTPGLVLTWERTSTAAGRRYGHTAITAGDGHTTYSDFVERNTSNRGRSGLRIFMPIA